MIFFCSLLSQHNIEFHFSADEKEEEEKKFDKKERSLLGKTNAKRNRSKEKQQRFFPQEFTKKCGFMFLL